MVERRPAGLHQGGYRRPSVRHCPAHPRRRRSGADLQQHEDRHVLPREVQEHRRVRACRARPSDGSRDAARCQAHGLQRQVHRPAVGAFAARRLPPAREEQHLPRLQDDRHVRQRVRLLRALFLLDLRAGERIEGQRQGEDRRAGFGPDPHRSGCRVRLFDRTRHLVDPRGGLRGHHHQQQPRDRLDRLYHQRQTLFRAAYGRGRDECHPPREAEGHRRLARRTDGHQPGRAAGRTGRAHHRHRLRGDPQRRGPRLLRADHGGAGHPAARGRGRDGHRGRSACRSPHRLSGAGASELRAGRPRHADRLERGAPAPLPADGRRGQ